MSNVLPGDAEAAGPLTTALRSKAPWDRKKSLVKRFSAFSSSFLLSNGSVYIQGIENGIDSPKNIILKSTCKRLGMGEELWAWNFQASVSLIHMVSKLTGHCLCSVLPHLGTSSDLALLFDTYASCREWMPMIFGGEDRRQPVKLCYKGL